MAEMGARAPLSLRWAERPGSSPLRVAVVAALVLGVVFVAAEAWLGRLGEFSADAHLRSDFRIALGLIGLTSYLLGAFSAAVRGAERTLRELAPSFLRAEDAQAALAAVTGRRETRRLRGIGALGALAMLGVPLATNLGFETYALWEIPPEAVAHRLLLGPLGWLVARFNAVVWSESRRFSLLGASALRVDLLDLSPLAALSRAGLRHALLGAGLLSFLLVAFLDDDVAPGLPFVLTAACVLNVALTVAALWLAVRGAHQAIVRAKAAESARCDLMIRAQGERGAAHAPGALADALAWKRFVADAPDWPLDLSALGRLAFYLAIPLGSWLGSALVELAVERLFGG
jgi:hypothetical protein